MRRWSLGREWASLSPRIGEFEALDDEIIVDQVQENLDFMGRMFSLPLPLVALLLIGFAAGRDTIPIFEMEISTDLVGNAIVIVLVFLIIQAYIATQLIKQIYTCSGDPEVIEFILKTHASIFNPYRDGFLTGLVPIVAQGLVFALVITAAGLHYGWYGEKLDFSNLCALGSEVSPVVNNILETVIVGACKAAGHGYPTNMVYEPISIGLSALFLFVVLFYGATFLVSALTLSHPSFESARQLNSPGLAATKIVLFMAIVLGAFFPETLLDPIKSLFGGG